MSNRRLIIVCAVLVFVVGVALLMGQPAQAGQRLGIVGPVMNTSAEAMQSDNPYATYFDEQIPAYLEAQGIVGAVVTVVEDGDVAFMEGYGYADLEGGVPMDPERTVMHVGSAGKTFTAVAVMQLVEQGLINLDADVTTYLDFAIPATYPEPITVRHLLTHTSGFAANDLGIIVTDPARLASERQFLIKRMPPRVRPPGEEIGYSNYGLTLLGYVVERVTGTSLSNYLGSHVLTPLGMDHSSAQIMPPTSMVEELAVGYRAGQPQPVEYIQAFGAAPVRTTAADMAAYLLANLQLGQYGDARILQTDTARMMQTQQFSADPHVNGIGLGFYEMSCNGQRVLGHLGTTSNFHTLIFMLPDEQVGVLISFNSAEAVSLMPSGVVLHDFMNHFYPFEVAYLTPPADFAGREDQYTGTYFLNNRHSMATVEKTMFLADAVQVRAPGDGTLRLTVGGVTRPYVEVEPDVFQQQGADTMLVFHRDDAGRVSAASLSSRAVYTLERRPWYEAPSLTIAALIGMGAIFLLSLIAAAASLLLGKSGGLTVTGQWLALLVPALNLAFLAGVLLIIGPVTQGAGGISARVVLTLPIVAAVLTLALAGISVGLWTRHEGALLTRLSVSLLSGVGIVYALVLSIWNLLGWRL